MSLEKEPTIKPTALPVEDVPELGLRALAHPGGEGGAEGGPDQRQVLDVIVLHAWRK
jgi:hypothetical protein